MNNRRATQVNDEVIEGWLGRSLWLQFVVESAAESPHNHLEYEEDDLPQFAPPPGEENVPPHDHYVKEVRNGETRWVLCTNPYCEELLFWRLNQQREFTADSSLPHDWSTPLRNPFRDANSW